MSFARRRRKYDGRTDRAGDDGANLFGRGLPRCRRLAGPGYPLEENVTTDSGRVPPCAPPAGAPAGTHGNNASWEEKLVAPARGPGRSTMRKPGKQSCPHTRGRIEYGRPGRPVVRLLRFIDI
jgi:hypothetical protein